MKSTILITLACVAIATLSGCSTTQETAAGPQAKIAPMKTACLTTHGDNSVDMDAAVQRNLENHGVTVSIAPACEKQDMNVSYTDAWYWDLAMYLRSMDIRFYRAPSGGLIASGHWKNSPLHQWPNADGVVQDLMDDMFVRAGEPGVLRTTSASN